MSVHSLYQTVVGFVKHCYAAIFHLTDHKAECVVNNNGSVEFINVMCSTVPCTEEEMFSSHNLHIFTSLVKC